MTGLRLVCRYHDRPSAGGQVPGQLSRPSCGRWAGIIPSAPPLHPSPPPFPCPVHRTPPPHNPPLPPPRFCQNYTSRSKLKNLFGRRQALVPRGPACRVSWRPDFKQKRLAITTTNTAKKMIKNGFLGQNLDIFLYF